jgi:hypothetical protein
VQKVGCKNKLKGDQEFFYETGRKLQHITELFDDLIVYDLDCLTTFSESYKLRGKEPKRLTARFGPEYDKISLSFTTMTEIMHKKTDEEVFKFMFGREPENVGRYSDKGTKMYEHKWLKITSHEIFEKEE